MVRHLSGPKHRRKGSASASKGVRSALTDWELVAKVRKIERARPIANTVGGSDSREQVRVSSAGDSSTITHLVLVRRRTGGCVEQDSPHRGHAVCDTGKRFVGKLAVRTDEPADKLAEQVPRVDELRESGTQVSRRGKGRKVRWQNWAHFGLNFLGQHWLSNGHSQLLDCFMVFLFWTSS